MIEQYFSEDNVKVESVQDKGVAITFTVSCPEWNETQTLTLSDLGIARVLMLDTKYLRREEFLNIVKDLFGKDGIVYSVPLWEFPIPEEWAATVKSHINSLIANKGILSLNVPYIFDTFDVPLFRLCFLRGLYVACNNGIVKMAFPNSFQRYLENPSLLFEDREEEELEDE